LSITTTIANREASLMKNSSFPGDVAVDHLQRSKSHMARRVPNAESMVGWRGRPRCAIVRHASARRQKRSFLSASEHRKDVWHTIRKCATLCSPKGLILERLWARRVAQMHPRTCHFVPLFSMGCPQEAVFFTLFFVRKVKKEAASDGRPWPVPLE
jgi:hypothetical protein